MTHSSFSARLTALLRQFRRNSDGGVITLEFLLVVPLMLWAYVGMLIFFDAYRTKTEAQSAAFHIADLLSRQTDVLTTQELELFNDVYEFLAGGIEESRMRVSLMTRDAPGNTPEIAWSYGTRGLLPLQDVVDLLSATVEDALSNGASGLPLGLLNSPGQGAASMSPTARERLNRRFGELTAPTATANTSSEPTDPATATLTGRYAVPEEHFPADGLLDRVEPVLSGESLIVVEAFSSWAPGASDLFGMPILSFMRFSPVAVTRPRFSPFLNYEGAEVTFLSQGTELPPVWTPPPPEPVAPPVEEQVVVTVPIVNTTFTAPTPPAGFSHTTITRPNNSVVNSFLGPFGGATRTAPVTYNVNLGGESRRAVIEFDLLIIDTWDGFNPSWTRPEGDILALQVNGSSIAAEPFSIDMNITPRYGANRRTVTSRNEGVFTTTMSLVRSGVNFAGNSGWHDQLWRVRVDITAPVQTFTFGLSARLDEDVTNESFGITNFSVIAERAPRNAQHFVPPAAAGIGNDPLLAFPRFGGCPDPRIAAPTHNLRQNHTATILRHRVEARGQQQVNQCPQLQNLTGDSRNRTLASSTYVLDWTDDGNRAAGTRLRIRTNDYNNGNTCDANLLIRSPTGQWFFNDDITLPTLWNFFVGDRNAHIDLGWAPTGEYHIWAGAYNVANCSTDLVFERY